MNQGGFGSFMATMMVVDDACNVRTIIRDMLLAAGHDVVGEAANGLEAVENYIRLNPDLVIMDLNMPEKNGVEALREIKAFDPTARVIMCSTVSQKQAMLEAIMAGAKDFILKPLQKEKMLDSIKRLL